MRYFDVKPWVTVAVGVGAAVFGAFYFAATGYLVFRDDLLAASLARQARMRVAYEDRVASLRADIDRLTSRQLLNQEAFEVRLEELLGRQAALDARQDIIATLSQTARGAGLVSGETGETPMPRLRPNDTDEIDETVTGSIFIDPAPPRFADAGLRGVDIPEVLPDSEESERIGEAETSIATLAREQVAFVEQMAAAANHRSTKIAEVLKDLGYDPGFKPPETGLGGPFLPLDDNVDPEAFRENVRAINEQIAQYAELRELAVKLPLAKPMPAARITSRYGRRMDPFLRRPAMHAGIDFKASTGSPVRATGAGVVRRAQYTGGYGNMVEIDHGRGVVTRYAHLSRLLVKKGARVEEGTIVGKVGSTGRSTGPHLHYEVRTNGRAIDPMRYINAGMEITPLL